MKAFVVLFVAFGSWGFGGVSFAHTCDRSSYWGAVLVDVGGKIVTHCSDVRTLLILVLIEEFDVALVLVLGEEGAGLVDLINAGELGEGSGSCPASFGGCFLFVAHGFSSDWGLGFLVRGLWRGYSWG